MSAFLVQPNKSEATRGQCDDARDVLMCLSAALFLEIFLMSFLVERHQNRFACLLYKPRTKGDEDRAARQEEKTKPTEKIRGCG